MEMNTVAIITARSKSTRLPNKVLADIDGQPMLWHIVNRVQQSKVDNVVVATVEGDDKVINFCKEYNIDYYAGSENDILDRLYQTAKQFKADIIVRVWGDSPLIQPQEIDKALKYLRLVSPSYFTWSTKGGIVGILGLNILADAWFNVKRKRDRHWIHKYLSHCNGAIIAGPGDKPITVDTQEDLDFIREIYARNQANN